MDNGKLILLIIAGLTTIGLGLLTLQKPETPEEERKRKTQEGIEAFKLSPKYMNKFQQHKQSRQRRRHKRRK